MQTTNLSNYTLPQLRQLSNRITKEISRRDGEAKAKLIKKLRKMASDEGLALDDLVPGVVSAGTKAKKGAGKGNSSVKAPKVPTQIKYRNPNDPSQGWSGMGRRPEWFKLWLEEGGSLVDLENAAQGKRVRRKAAEAPAADDDESQLVAGADDAESQASDSAGGDDVHQHAMNYRPPNR